MLCRDVCCVRCVLCFDMRVVCCVLCVVLWRVVLCGDALCYLLRCIAVWRECVRRRVARRVATRLLWRRHAPCCVCACIVVWCSAAQRIVMVLCYVGVRIVELGGVVARLCVVVATLGWSMARSFA